LALARFARDDLGVPAFLINATINDLEPMLFDELRLFTAIYVRESASEQLLATHGIRASIVPDLTFAAEPVRRLRR
jgi:polysaccharide pyruvyl transferase WcaK-like protein